MRVLLFPVLILASSSAFAAQIKNAKCSDMAKLNENITPQYMAVIDGYDKAGKKVSEEIDMAGIVSESKKVTEQCAKHKSSKIDNVKKDLKNSSAASATAAPLNPLKAKCKDFVALGEDVQPVAVFWIAGHDKSGKLKDGEVDEEFLAQPIATLVEDCKAKPMASFYDKTKAWIKKHI